MKKYVDGKEKQVFHLRRDMNEHESDVEMHEHFSHTVFSPTPYHGPYCDSKPASSIRELQQQYGNDPLIVIRNGWLDADLCLYVEHTDADHAYGTKFLDGKPYNEHFRCNVYTKEFRLYTGPSKDAIIRQMGSKNNNTSSQ